MFTIVTLTYVNERNLFKLPYEMKMEEN